MMKGKFKTIVLASVLFMIGCVSSMIYFLVISLKPWFLFAALTLVMFGNGIATPWYDALRSVFALNRVRSMSTFLGDQFSPEQDEKRSQFFSWFYLSIQVRIALVRSRDSLTVKFGTIISTILTPVLVELETFHYAFIPIAGFLILEHHSHFPAVSVFALPSLLLGIRRYNYVELSKDPQGNAYSLFFKACFSRSRVNPLKG
jgi:dipeptide/tripeptide permease